MLRWTKRVLGGLLSLGLGGLLYQTITTALDERRYQPPGQLIEVYGAVMHLRSADQVRTAPTRLEDTPVQVRAAGGDTGDNAGQRAAIAERQRLLAGALVDVLTAALPAASFELDTRRQPSRLYGHGLADRMNKNAK